MKKLCVSHLWTSTTRSPSLYFGCRTDTSDQPLCPFIIVLRLCPTMDDVISILVSETLRHLNMESVLPLFRRTFSTVDSRLVSKTSIKSCPRPFFLQNCHRLRVYFDTTTRLVPNQSRRPQFSLVTWSSEVHPSLIQYLPECTVRFRTTFTHKIIKKFFYYLTKRCKSQIL